MKLTVFLIWIAGLWPVAAAADGSVMFFDPFAEVEMIAEHAGSVRTLLDQRGVFREQYRQALGRLFNQELPQNAFDDVANEIVASSYQFPLIEERLWSRRDTPFQGNFSGYLLHQNVRSIDLLLWDGFLTSEIARLRELDPAAADAIERESDLKNFTVTRPLETLANFLKLQSAYPHITSFKKMLEARPKLIRFAGDPSTDLVANHHFAVHTSPRAIHSEFALIRVKDCLVDSNSSDRKFMRSRLFAPAIGGAATSLFFQDRKWTGQVLAVPFQMYGAIHYSVEANGQLNRRIVRSDRRPRADEPVDSNIFDQWLELAYADQRLPNNGFVVGSSLGAGIVSAQIIRPSTAWAASRTIGHATSTESVDRLLETTFADEVRNPDSTWVEYLDLSQAKQMLYEITLVHSSRLHRLANPANTTKEQIGPEAVRKQLFGGSIDEAARALSRFATEPPRDLKIAKIFHNLGYRDEEWSLTKLNVRGSTLREVFALGGVPAISGYILSRDIDFATMGGVLSVENLRLTLRNSLEKKVGLQDLSGPVDYAVRMYLETRPSAEKANELREKLPYRGLKTDKRLRYYAARRAETLDSYLDAVTWAADDTGTSPTRIQKANSLAIFQQTFLSFLSKTSDPGALRQLAQIPLLAGNAPGFREFLKTAKPYIQFRAQFMEIVDGALDPKIGAQKEDNRITRSALLDHFSLFENAYPPPTVAERSYVLHQYLRSGPLGSEAPVMPALHAQPAGLCVAYSRGPRSAP